MAERTEHLRMTKPGDIGRVVMAAQKDHEKVAAAIRIAQLARDMEREAVLLRLKNAL